MQVILQYTISNSPLLTSTPSNPTNCEYDCLLDNYDTHYISFVDGETSWTSTIGTQNAIGNTIRARLARERHVIAAVVEAGESIAGTLA
jgi:hypothetical protein